VALPLASAPGTGARVVMDDKAAFGTTASTKLSSSPGGQRAAARRAPEEVLAQGPAAAMADMPTLTATLTTEAARQDAA